jgi:uncharacterized membrane protein YczE
MSNRTDTATILMLPFVTLMASCFASRVIQDTSADAEQLAVRVCWVSLLCSVFLLIYFWQALRQRPALGIYIGFCIFALFLPIRALPSSSALTHGMHKWSYLQTVFQFFGSLVMLYFAGCALVKFWRNNLAA